MSVVLDAGAFIAFERQDVRVQEYLALARWRNEALRTTAPVVAQVWRDGARQAAVARLLNLVDIRSVGVAEAKAAGRLLVDSGTSDAVDALVALVARPGDAIVTSDPDDLRRTSAALGYPVSIVRV